MRPSLRLGRIAHIEVGFHWSVLVIMVLLAWSLADAALPEFAPGSSVAVYWVAALIAVVLMFASLLAHELAHSIVAERRGVQVHGITLWLLGGVSQLHGEAKTPRDEMDITAAGPLTSIVLSLTFGALAAMAAVIGGPTVVVAVLAWLGAINMLLALFNLLPGAPLDGGRLLHAAIWHRTGDRSRATMASTRAGSWVGYLLIGLGIMLALLGDLSALWFVLLGWFLLGASRAEATHELLHGALSSVRVRDVMTEHPIVAPEDISLRTFVDDWFLRRDWSGFPLVTPSGEVSALVTLARVKSMPRHDWDRLTAGAVGDPVATVASGAPNEPLPELLERMATATGGSGRALVFDDGAFVGIITPTDVQRAIDLAALRSPRARAEPGEQARTPTASSV